MKSANSEAGLGQDARRITGLKPEIQILIAHDEPSSGVQGFRRVGPWPAPTAIVKVVFLSASPWPNSALAEQRLLAVEFEILSFA